MPHPHARLSRSVVDSFFARRLLATALAVASLTACGGTTVDASHSGINGGGSGGESLDGGPGGVGSGGAGSGGKGWGGEGPGGGTSFGGGGGAGGGECACAAIGCGPGYHSVSIPGQCCPSCEVCTVDCPLAPPCPAGEQPVTLPGQCCATSCGPRPFSPDAGVSCTLAPPPSCPSNTWPPCAPTWAAATETIPACGTPGPGSSEYLETCGAYHAVTATGIDSSTSFFYDASGKLVGQLDEGIGGVFCQAFDPSFVAPRSCSSLCAGDAGSSLCGNGVIDAGEECDGANMNGVTCNSATMALHPHGVVKCSSTCKIDVSGCTY